eukprot:CAMPEP_0174230958 /NCGR_PEP_ID=MMETSP0417-20130205/1592_1 /TAXON_ID=242541 /ORGANISM="Mayorella sp, Strain BSH-02190019" /LENGTH=445 /DNA_ID=CAMNT_0015308735 /DNA_START=113 /DNA_END=1450 /DNA_ORIENTATION=+
MSQFPESLEELLFGDPSFDFPLDLGMPNMPPASHTPQPAHPIVNHLIHETDHLSHHHLDPHGFSELGALEEQPRSTLSSSTNLGPGDKRSSPSDNNKHKSNFSGTVNDSNNKPADSKTGERIRKRRRKNTHVIPTVRRYVTVSEKSSATSLPPLSATHTSSFSTSPPSHSSAPLLCSLSRFRSSIPSNPSAKQTGPASTNTLRRLSASASASAFAASPSSSSSSSSCLSTTLCPTTSFSPGSGPDAPETVSSSSRPVSSVVESLSSLHAGASLSVAVMPPTSCSSSLSSSLPTVTGESLSSAAVGENTAAAPRSRRPPTSSTAGNASAQKRATKISGGGSTGSKAAARDASADSSGPMDARTRGRLASKKHRQKQKQYVSTLEERVRELESERRADHVRIDCLEQRCALLQDELTAMHRFMNKMLDRAFPEPTGDRPALPIADST